MVRPILRSLDTHQVKDIVDEANGGFAPVDRDNYVLAISAAIGPDDGPGEEIFHFWVCSPKWIATDYADEPWLRAMLMLPTWDYHALVAAVEDLCRGIEGRTWTEVGLKLSRYMNWEFQDEAARAAGMK